MGKKVVMCQMRKIWCQMGSERRMNAEKTPEKPGKHLVQPVGEKSRPPNT
jgi:hypothetical protein